jgi:hypothetical protein
MIDFDVGQVAASDLAKTRRQTFLIAEECARRREYGNALCYYLLLLAHDGLGRFGTTQDADARPKWVWSAQGGISSSGIFERVAKCANSLELTLNDLHELYLPGAQQLIQHLSSLRPTRTADDIWNRCAIELAPLIAKGIRWPGPAQARDPPRPVQEKKPESETGPPTDGIVPEFSHMYVVFGYAQLQQYMNPEQREFYEGFRLRWMNGDPQGAGTQLSYVFCLAYDVIEAGDVRHTERELERLINIYGNNEKIRRYVSGWRASALVSIGRYEDALKLIPELSSSSNTRYGTSYLLSVKFELNMDVSARDILTLFGPRVTEYVRDKLEAVSLYIEATLSERVAHDGSILAHWANHKDTPRFFFHSRLFTGFEGYDFRASEYVRQYCVSLTREAENAVRDDGGVPRVGEGWLGETRLFYEIRDAFSEHLVVRHARPKFLRQQHLDVFIPELMVALEYQGTQHDQPVEFFGGVEAFQRTQERDSRKRRLCEANGVRLIEVRPYYQLADLLISISQRA